MPRPASSSACAELSVTVALRCSPVSVQRAGGELIELVGGRADAGDEPAFGVADAEIDQGRVLVQIGVEKAIDAGQPVERDAEPGRPRQLAGQPLGDDLGVTVELRQQQLVEGVERALRDEQRRGR